jgi:uncharacterized Zn finger protein
MDGGTISITCPNCRDKSLYFIQNKEGEQEIECSWCGQIFIATIKIFVDVTSTKMK